MKVVLVALKDLIAVAKESTLTDDNAHGEEMVAEAASILIKVGHVAPKDLIAATVKEPTSMDDNVHGD